MLTRALLLAILIRFTSVSACSSGGTSAPSAAASFAGAYRGEIQGTPATLTIQHQGEQITATIDAGGYRYIAEGQVTGSRATGSMKDPQTGGAMAFDASLTGATVRFVLTIPGGGSMTLDFQRTGGGAAIVGGTASAPPPPPPSPPTPSVSLDGRLIGSWRHQEMLGDPMSGTMTIVWQLDVRADGTYTYGSDTSQQHGRWRTQGNVVEVSEDGVGWTPYARFIIDGRSMQFTYTDGKKGQLWHRQ